VSTAQLVPETWQLTGDDAAATLRDTGRRRLLADSFRRLRVADGFSHARSLAFMISLVLIQGLIALVGLASVLGKSGSSGVIVKSIRSAVPGPPGQILTAAVDHAQSAGFSHRHLALVLGFAGALITGTTAMGQFERALNRIYGVEQDRPTVQKYALAFALALTTGTLAVLAFIAMTYGRALGDSMNNDVVTTIWNWGHWPLAVLLIACAVTSLLRWCPKRRQPAFSWLAYGSTVSVLGWVLVTLALTAFFHFSNSFGQTYGPLAGLVGLLLWSLLSASAILFGSAVAAELEAVRAGRPAPQDVEKVEDSEPEHANRASVSVN
jgi:YihY family inner membrane protein